MQPNEKLTVKFGNIIMQQGFTSIPNVILNYYSNLDISAKEMMCIIHIWQFWWENGRKPFPGIREISEKMGVYERTAQRYLEPLVKRGLILRRERVFFNSNMQTTNEYDFTPLIKQIEEIYLQEHPEQNNKTENIVYKPHNDGGVKIDTPESNGVEAPNFEELKTDEANKIGGVNFDVPEKSGVSDLTPGGCQNCHPYNNTNIKRLNERKKEGLELSTGKLSTRAPNELDLPTNREEALILLAKNWNVPVDMIRIAYISMDDQERKGNIITDKLKYLKETIRNELLIKTVSHGERPKYGQSKESYNKKLRS